MPAVRTSVIPIDSELIGGCNAAEAISHADDAINKSSLSAAETFATIAGKNFLKVIECHLAELACAKFTKHQSQSLIHVEDTALTNATALEPDTF